MIVSDFEATVKLMQVGWKQEDITADTAATCYYRAARFTKEMLAIDEVRNVALYKFLHYFDSMDEDWTNAQVMWTAGLFFDDLLPMVEACPEANAVIQTWLADMNHDPSMLN